MKQDNRKTEVISRDKIVEKIATLRPGELWSVEFIKRTDGSFRRMLCAQQIKKHLKGGTLGYDPAKKNLIPTFDMVAVRRMSAEELAKRPPYRSIAIEGIVRARIKGVVYEVVEDAIPLNIEQETVPKTTAKPKRNKKVAEVA